jgi:hypothetical protein
VLNSKFAIIAANVLKTPILRNILIGCLTIAVVLPAYTTFFLMPSFTDQLKEDTEDDAARSAAHLVSYLGLDANRLVQEYFTPGITDIIWRVMKDFQLEKIKIFSVSGEIVYSTESREIGQINENHTFMRLSRKGNPIQ